MRDLYDYNLYNLYNLLFQSHMQCSLQLDLCLYLIAVEILLNKVMIVDMLLNRPVYRDSHRLCGGICQGLTSVFG